MTILVSGTQVCNSMCVCVLYFFFVFVFVLIRRLCSISYICCNCYVYKKNERKEDGSERQSLS